MNKIAFEQKVFSILKEMNITPKGFYRYEDFSELIGQQKSNWPLTTSLKVMIEILYVTPRKEQIEGFLKSALDNQSSYSMIFGLDDLDDTQKIELGLTNANNVDYFGYSKINSLITEKSITSENIQNYQKAGDVLAVKKLVDGLDDFAHQRIPPDILALLKTMPNTEQIHAWGLFEEAVYVAFKQCIGYHVRQLGKEKLFQEEPEGVAIIENGDKKAFLYECKSAKSAYTMTANHKRAYVDYIKKKKKEISVLNNAELRYFVIVGPSFCGDIENRRKQIHQETGILVVYLKAEILAIIAQWSHGIDSEIKRLIDLSELFSEMSYDELTIEKINSFIKNFDNKYKYRY